MFKLIWPLQNHYSKLRAFTLAAVCLLTVVWSNFSSAAYSKSSILSAYIYRLAENIQWPSASGEPHYTIHVIDDNSKIYDTLKQLSSKSRLHGKPFKVSRSHSGQLPSSVDLVFISEQKVALYPSVLAKTVGKNVLIVSYGATNQRTLMINIFQNKDNKLGFEINKSNVLNRNLGINPDIILLGGTEIDVAQLYKEGQIQLADLETKVSRLEQRRSQMEEA
ncbi:YfiR family protein [Vibrio sonorensis]|uniref:YfiR family protein n=1 Tax=Vibrio sonorensis TaxID=1004316 RepID=UPI0008DB02D6|nr:YfiR family protein [Vibrio sonorensis]